MIVLSEKEFEEKEKEGKAFKLNIVPKKLWGKADLDDLFNGKMDVEEENGYAKYAVDFLIFALEKFEEMEKEEEKRRPGKGKYKEQINIINRVLNEHIELTFEDEEAVH